MRRTYAPRGRTPALRHRARRKSASMAAALGYAPLGGRARLCWQVQGESYDTAALIDLLEMKVMTPFGQWTTKATR